MEEFLYFLKVISAGILILVGIALTIASPWFIWGDSNVAIIKQSADKTWAANGFQVIGYQGYELTLFGRPGGCVWYTVKRGETLYDGCLSKWGQEFHIYNLQALNAITNKHSGK